MCVRDRLLLRGHTARSEDDFMHEQVDAACVRLERRQRDLAGRRPHTRALDGDLPAPEDHFAARGAGPTRGPVGLVRMPRSTDRRAILFDHPSEDLQSRSECQFHNSVLREELTLAQIDDYAEATDELDVQGLLAFAERILPRASDLWVQASLDYKQRLQQLFFPEGIAFDGNRFNRTAATAPLFNYLAPSESADEKMVSRLGIVPAEAATAASRA
jgi:hypothetical protein